MNGPDCYGCYYSDSDLYACYASDYYLVALTTI
jgi:hypothetical protein